MKKNHKNSLPSITSAAIFGSALACAICIGAAAQLKTETTNANELSAQLHDVSQQLEHLQSVVAKKDLEIDTLDSNLQAVTATRDSFAILYDDLVIDHDELKVKYNDLLKKEPVDAIEVFEMTATAYTAYCKGCTGITKTGINLRENPGKKVIAVDPSVIPLGSKVWVEGYGEAVAADVGSAIKGNIIDVFIPNYDEAIAWGRKKVTVKVLN